MTQATEFERGDLVWVTKYCYSRGPSSVPDWWEWEKGQVVYADSLWIRARVANGRVVARTVHEVREYDIVTQLADLVRCPECRDFDHNQCRKHTLGNLNVASLCASAGVTNTDGHISFAVTSTTTNRTADDADTDDVFDHRRRLSRRERARRQRRRRMKRRSQSRNR